MVAVNGLVPISNCLLHGLTLIPAMISNYIDHNTWSEITCGTVEIWEWISNFILHIIMDVIIHPCWD